MSYSIANTIMNCIVLQYQLRSPRTYHIVVLLYDIVVLLYDHKCSDSSLIYAENSVTSHNISTLILFMRLLCIRSGAALAKQD